MLRTIFTFSIHSRIYCKGSISLLTLWSRVLLEANRFLASQDILRILWNLKVHYRYLNKGWPTRWHLLYYILLNMFQTLIRPSSGASEYLLCCVRWLEACWCYVAMQWSHKQTKVEVWLSYTERITILYTQIPHHQQTSRCITSARLKSAYTTQQVLASSWRWTY